MGPVLLCFSSLLVLTEPQLIYRTSRGGPSRSIPDQYKRSIDIIEKSGRIAEEHEVITEDGYKINIDRIPADQLDTKRVVLLQIGIGGTSNDWFIFEQKSFPLMLSLAGYDVWVSNPRGSSHSRGHVNLTYDDSDYWDFSFHEEGLYDLSGSIDYILNSTGAEQIFLVGHSRGTTMSYVLLSLRPEYNHKVRLMLSFAPVAYLKHAISPTLQLIFNDFSVQQLQKLFSRARIFSLPGAADKLFRLLTRMFCGADKITQPICTNLVGVFFGPDYLNNKDSFDTWLQYWPADTAIKELLHYMQLGKTDEFAPYDFGSAEKNLAVYNSTAPPVYPLHKITAPLSFHYTDSDYIVSRKDMDKLINQIPNVAGVYRVPYSQFNHVNFISGSRSDELLYTPTIQLMESYMPDSG